MEGQGKREMTLKEIVGRLHENHIARREFDALMKLQPMTMTQAETAMEEAEREAQGFGPLSDIDVQYMVDVAVGRKTPPWEIRERKAMAWDEVVAIVRAGGIYFHCYERIESLVESFDKEAADGK